MPDLPRVKDLLLERRQSVLFATLNRPQAKNALNAAIIHDLMRLCDWLPEQKDIRALVLRGAGGSFCGGGDIKEFGQLLMTPEPGEGDKDGIAKSNRVFGDLLLKLDALPQVFITLVEGPCFGGANGFLSVADVAIAAEDARFSLSETTLGIVPTQIGPFLVRKIGLFNARRLALTGAHFTAREAERIGLVDKVTDGPTALREQLTEILNAVGRCEPAANAATKKLFNDVSAAIASDLLDRAAEEFANSLRNQGKVGAASFAAKQAPPWVEVYSELGKE